MMAILHLANIWPIYIYVADMRNWLEGNVYTERFIPLVKLPAVHRVTYTPGAFLSLNYPLHHSLHGAI